MVPQVSPARRAQVVVILDHDIPAGSFQSAFRQKALIDFSRANSLEFIQSAGISYQLLMQGRLATGSLLVTCGQHVAQVGVIGALGLRFSPEDLARWLQGGELTLPAPQPLHIRLEGDFAPGATAYDIALMSRALLGHEAIKKYTTIWMDTVRDGQVGLANTNKLVRFYDGTTGLKTGSTAKAGFCISATAKREGMHLICVIMGAESRDIRNAAATSLLDWGFANFALYTHKPEELTPLKVLGGVSSLCHVAYPEFSTVVRKSDVGKVEYVTDLPQDIPAPVKCGDAVGKITYRLTGETIGESEICATEGVENISFWGLLARILAKMSLF